MNRIPSREQVENLRQRYPVGTRIVLHRMDAPYAPIPPGTKGTVTYVDDMGQIGVASVSYTHLQPQSDPWRFQSTAGCNDVRLDDQLGDSGSTT